MRKAKVHRLFASGPVTEPDAGMIETLKGLINGARRCELKGFGFFTVDGNDNLRTGWSSGTATRRDMAAGATMLHARIIKAWLDG